MPLLHQGSSDGVQAGDHRLVEADDLIIGKVQNSTTGILVECSTRCMMLLHPPGDHGAEAGHDALVATARTPPVELKRSLAWNQGSEMGRHREFTLAINTPVYFCGPASS